MSQYQRQKVDRSHGFAAVHTTKATKAWAPFVAGGAGGMTAALFTSPLDVLKTRLQSDYYQTQLVVARVILSSIRYNEGWRGLFRGIGPNLVGVIPASAVKFYTYGTSKRILARSLNGDREAVWVHVLAAASAGVATSTITNPIWLVKTRLQLDKSPLGANGSVVNRRYKNSLDCITQIVRQEGLKGLYRGMTASYLGVLESTMHWVLYEQAKSRLKRREEQLLASGRQSGWDSVVGWVGQVGAAGGTKLFAAIAAYPHEVVRTRLRQAPTENGHLRYTGLLQCFRLIWKEEGLAALYGGLTPHLLRVVPSTAIMFGVYELTMRVLHAD